MDQELLHRFDDTWPDDEEILISSWLCIKCKKEFVDPEEYPTAYNPTDNYNNWPVEPKLYWLGIEPICEGCAVESGIPPIDTR